MAQRRRRKKTGHPFWRGVGRALLFLLKLPVFAYRGIRDLTHAARERRQERTVERRRSIMRANYQRFAVIETRDGSYNSWEQAVIERPSTIGIIIGARGTGKSALGMAILENVYAKRKRKCLAMGFRQDDLPSWVRTASRVEDIPSGALVLIDEGGILFSSRKSMSNANVLLSELLLVARHKDLSVVFISQNSSNLDVNILRQADYLLLKPSSLLQLDFERKKVKEIYEDAKDGFTRHAAQPGLLYVYSSEFQGFVSNPLPSFWHVSMSKSFSGGSK